jgi:hypothetical protein
MASTTILTLVASRLHWQTRGLFSSGAVFFFLHSLNRGRLSARIPSSPSTCYSSPYLVVRDRSEVSLAARRSEECLRSQPLTTPLPHLRPSPTAPAHAWAKIDTFESASLKGDDGRERAGGRKEEEEQRGRTSGNERVFERSSEDIERQCEQRGGRQKRARDL